MTNQPQPTEKRICVGKITTAHGIKGLVKILVYADDAKLLQGTVFTDKIANQTLDITLKNPNGKFYLAAIDGCDDRNQAETYRNTELWVSRDTLPETDEDEFYVEDLIGAAILTDKDEMIGTLKAIPNFGAGDLLEITPKGGGETFLIPLTDENVIEITNENIIIDHKIYEAFS